MKTRIFYNIKKQFDKFFIKYKNNNLALNDLDDKRLNYKSLPYFINKPSINKVTVVDIYKSNVETYIIDLQYSNGNTIEHLFYKTDIEEIKKAGFKDIQELLKSECNIQI